MPILENLLAPHPDVAIVLSTSWVRERSFSFARRCLSPSLKSRVIGATFHQREMRKDEFGLLPRGMQVVEDVARRRPKAWFAIDDDYEGWPAWCRGNLIKTEGNKGLGDPRTQQAVVAMLACL